MIIRPETDADHRAIHTLTRDAFAPMPFGDDGDAFLPERLRDAGDLLVSLVAVEDDLIGHVALSPAQAGPGTWAGLGPVSVRADKQRQGIGTRLAQTALEKIRNDGFDGCVLIGNPDVYGPMGFRSGGITYRDLSDHLVQWISFGALRPSGGIRFAPALEA